MELHDSALVLHVRAYRETSVIAQFLTRDRGRIAGVYKGAKRKGGVAVQPFTVGLLGLTGRGTLMTVTRFERETEYALEGEHLVAGFYVLELVTRLLAEHQAEPGVFDAAHAVLGALTHGAEVEATLRPFELHLLHELGYGIDFETDAETGEPIEPARKYVFRNEFGFRAGAPGAPASYPGEVLLAIARRDFADPVAARFAKRIVRQALAPLLGHKPLMSRTMVAPRRSG